MKTRVYLAMGNVALALDEDGLLSITNMVVRVATDGNTISDVRVPDFENMIHVADVEDWDQSPWENSGMSRDDIARYSEILASMEEISR